MKSYYLSNEQMLQNYGAMFQNLAKEIELKTELEEYGYDEAKIQEGKTLYDKARQTFDANVKETREETTASLNFKEKYQNFHQTFTIHRKKARIVFDDDTEASAQLKLKNYPSKAFVKFLEETRAFYQLLDTNEPLRNTLKSLKVTEQDIKNQLQLLGEVEKAYADYMKEKGESQQATKDKDNAFDKLHKWVTKFHKVASIALEEKPQLLESIGKFVRS